MHMGLWGWDVAVAAPRWRKVIVDATGHLITTPAAAAVFPSHCYGYDGAAWQELLVESAANPNLRTRLYDGVNPVVSVGTAADIADANRGLLTQAGVRGWDGAFWKSVNVEDDVGDALTNARASLSSVSKLYGYNEATWDRLRVMTPADAFVTPTFALQVASFLMGYDGGDWNMVRVDAAGHLQVDIITGAAVETRCHGWDGANWQTLLVEDATDFNLRVKLYDGANGISSDVIGTVPLTAGARALLVRSQVCGYANYPFRQHRSDLDGRPASASEIVMETMSLLYGYNGATFDRLRTYGTGILKVGRAEVGLLDVRMTGTGQVGATGARRLYWMVLNPSAGLSLFELSDATVALQPIVLDHFDTTRDGHIMTFDPPMEFSSGIYLETFTNLTSIIFGYL